MIVFVYNMQKYKEKNNNTMLFSHSKSSCFSSFKYMHIKGLYLCFMWEVVFEKKLVDEQPYQCA